MAQRKPKKRFTPTIVEGVRSRQLAHEAAPVVQIDPARRDGRQVTGQHDKMVLLKKGGEIEYKEGCFCYDFLTLLLDRHPQHFSGLLALDQGRIQDILPESIAYFSTGRGRGIYTTAEGAIKPTMSAVLRSAYQETRDGRVLVNPFLLESEAQAQELEQVREQHDKASLDRLLRYLRDMDDGTDKGSSPGR
jgi:hypothetical protein